MTVPKLAGKRVALRALEESDAPALAEAVAGSLAHLRRRFAWAEAAGEAELAAFIRAKAQDAEGGGSATFGAFELKGQRLVGMVALDPLEGKEQRAKLGLWVRADEQDKGYASEAGRLAVDFGFRALGLHRLYARIDPVNRAARKVLQKLGFRYEGCLRQDKRLSNRWIDQECWGALRADWVRPGGSRPGGRGQGKGARS